MGDSLSLIGINWRVSIPRTEVYLSTLPNRIDGPRFRKIEITDGYLDSCTVLSPTEAIDLVTDHCSNSALQSFRVAVNKVPIIAHVFQWESGLTD
jgi:hypothetical protein